MPPDPTDLTPLGARSSDPRLAAWGWTRHRELWWDGQQEEDRSRLEPGRVVKELRGVLEVQTASERIDTRIPGRYFQPGSDPAEVPTVGDWVLVPRERPPGDCWIERVLPRSSKFSRKVAGNQTVEQVVAANVDDLFIVMGLDGGFNLRRLERFLAAARDGGARPVVVLNKADLASDLAQRIAAVRDQLHGAALYVTSSKRDLGEQLLQLSVDGLTELRRALEPGRTIAFVGSSGVGKSTLVNTLFGEQVMRVRSVRERDERGQHTTSHRELVRLPGGTLLIDNPGVRELQGWLVDEGIEETFEEIRSIAADCRFRDCRHQQEPGCAVREALERGSIDEQRLDSFLKLEQESQQQAERRRERERAQESLRSRKRKARKTRRRPERHDDTASE
ncbi:MAG: ribosome small subunit-dependent GTPase A [Acidobacteria bacterium]|nr:MAG: ribosome small subunit-dependent GTPase A [Acidobacteriota bacterium]